MIGFGPPVKPSNAIYSIVLYPRYVTLFFLQGAKVPDPKKLLKGSGKIVHHIRPERAGDLKKPAIRVLITAALKSAKVPMVHAVSSRLIISSISDKQRPRQPDRPHKRAATGIAHGAIPALSFGIYLRRTGTLCVQMRTPTWAHDAEQSGSGAVSH